MSAPGDQFLRAESAGTQGTRKRKAPPEEEPADDDGAAPAVTTPRPGDPPLSDAELEAAAQRVAIVLTLGGTPRERMQRAVELGVPLWRAAHEGWDRETKHSLYDSDARQGALAAALGSVEKNHLLSMQILGAGSLFNIHKTTTTVGEWAGLGGLAMTFTAVDLVEPLAIGGVSELAENVVWVRADYTDLPDSIANESAGVTVLQWALFRAEDAVPLAQQLERTTAPGGSVVVVQQDRPDAVVELGKALNRIYNWTIQVFDLGDNTQQRAITLVAVKSDAATQERAARYSFPSIGLMKSFADVAEFNVYEQIVVCTRTPPAVGVWVLEIASTTPAAAVLCVKQLEATDDPTKFYKIIGVYSGSTTQPGEKRWAQHMSSLRGKTPHSSPLFQKAYDVLGAKLFARWVWRQARATDADAEAAVSNACAMIRKEQEHIDFWGDQGLCVNASKIAGVVDPAAAHHGEMMSLARHLKDPSTRQFVESALAKYGKTAADIFTLTASVASGSAASWQPPWCSSRRAAPRKPRL